MESHPTPPNTSIMGCKWTYHTKLHDNVSIACHKACLVSQGYKQIYGINYLDNFIPAAKFLIIRALLIITLNKQWKIHQLDVSNVFHDGTLKDTIYTIKPRGFEESQHPNIVCLLWKAIYGLKQAPQLWFHTFS